MKILVMDSVNGIGSYIRNASLDYGHDMLLADMESVSDVTSLTRMLQESDAQLLLDSTLDASFARLSSSAAISLGLPLLYVLQEIAFSGEANDVENILALSGGRCTVIKTSWIYGVDGFVRDWVERLADEPVVEVSSGLISSPTYARDLADALMTVLDAGLQDGFESLSFCGEGVCSLYDFVKEILDRVGYVSHVIPVRTSDPFCVLSDSTKFRQIYGLEIPHWKDSLTACLMDMDVLPFEYQKL
ncbi:MAG: hypothetical protein E7117_06695 [Bacteroidales bacterium]|nr:hypothetical protein [Bacteroidales bacterium]